MEHKEFYKMLDENALTQKVSHLWNRQKNEFKPDLAEKERGLLSTSERHMLNFFVGLWFGTTQENYEFKLIEAVRILDSHNINVITNWLINSRKFP